MTSVTFDQSRADALIHEIGQAILADPNYANRDWSGIALVFEVAQRQRMYGFVYQADDWEAETPDDFDLIEKAGELRDVMAGGPDGDRWVRCLVQILKPGPKINIQFDYDGKADWAVTPANHEEMVEKLRP